MKPFQGLGPGSIPEGRKAGNRRFPCCKIDFIQTKQDKCISNTKMLCLSAVDYCEKGLGFLADPQLGQKVSLITVTQFARYECLLTLYDLIQMQTYNNILEWINDVLLQQFIINQKIRFILKEGKYHHYY